eukprot:TRINITY_DN9128_c0_g1_i1.p2 TRINITY_DN9128_c0_g1~~TRINITY_DN9128_c0_g1_i1.p2  ORF type:complete len:164 (-),score=34.28 TRINITY_DN9128_c0_g1_i1:1909-2400(-)
MQCTLAIDLFYCLFLNVLVLFLFFFFLMIRRPPRSTHCISSAASDVYKRQVSTQSTWGGFICEQAGKRLNTITANSIHEGNQFEITVQPTYSPATIQIVVGIRNSLYGNAYTTIITYSNDTSYPDEQLLTVEYEAGDLITDMHLVVESDDNYDYNLITNITNQ